MKMYDVEMAMCFTKNLRIMAPDAETAEMLAELIFKGTDALTLGPSDLDDFEALAIPAFGTDDDDEDEDKALPPGELVRIIHPVPDEVKKV